MPEVALVCGFFNRPHLVRRTLMGLYRHKIKDVKFHIFDDGSSDETASKIEEIIEELEDPRFILKRYDHNVGLTKGLIREIKEIDCDFVAIHDAGDYSDSRRLSMQADRLRDDKNISVVGCHYINSVEDQGINFLRRPSADQKTKQDIIKDSTFTHGEVMFRLDSYHNVGGYRQAFKYSQDNDLWLRMIDFGKFSTVEQALYCRSVQMTGISYNSDSFAKQSAFYILGKKIASGEISEVVLDLFESKKDIFDILPKHDPQVQKVIMRGAIRAAVFGRPDLALQILDDHVVGQESDLTRICLGLMGGRAGKLALRNYYRLKGANRKYDLVQMMIADT